MSPTYFVFGTWAVKSRRSRSGAGVADGSGTVVRTSAQVQPDDAELRITRATRLWLTGLPASFSSAVTRGTP